MIRAALVFAIAPLHRLAERLTDTAMPGVKLVEEMSEDERTLLDRFPVTLGLDAEMARRLETEAAEEPPWSRRTWVRSSIRPGPYTDSARAKRRHARPGP